jgi:hypothetical protein
MAEEIRFKAIYDDSDINRALTGIVTSTEAANEATREYGNTTTQAFNTAAKSAEKATLAVVNNNKALSVNAARINELSKDIIAYKARLLQLEQGYDKFADKGSQSAKTVQNEMKRLSTEIQRTESNISELTDANKKLADSGSVSANVLERTSKSAKTVGGDIEGVTKRTGGLSNLFRVLSNRGGELIAQLGGAGQAAQFFGRQIGGAVTGVAGLAGGVALLIGGLVALLAIPVVLFFKKTQEGAELAEIKLAQLAASFKVVTDRLATFGGYVVGYISGQRSLNEVIASGIVSLVGIGGALSDAAKEAESYTIILQNFRKAQLDFQSDEIKAEARAKSFRLAVDDTTKSIGARTSALQKAGAIEAGLDERRIKDAEKELEFARRNATKGDGLLILDEKLIAAEKALADAVTDAEERKAQDKQTLIQLREESARAAEEERKALAALRAEYDRLLKQIQSLELEQLSPADRLRKEQEIALTEITRFETELKKAYKERKQVYDAADEFDRLRVLTNIKYEKAISDVTLEEIGKRLEAESEALKQKQSDEDAFAALQLSVLDKQKAIEIAKVDNIKDAGKDEEDAIRDKEKAKLQVELDFALRRKQVLEAQYGPDSLEVQLIREQIRNIELELAEIENVELSGFEGLKKKILDALKIDEEQAQLLAETAGGALNAYLEFLDATTEAQLAVQDEIIAKTEERIEKTQELLNIELERQKQGYANNVENLKQALDKQNKERDAAEQKRNAIARKAAKQRAAISAAEQIAETALLAVRIFSEAIEAAGIYGIILGAAGLAFVIARIAAVRAQAKAAQADTGFKEGTPFVEGPGGPKDDRISARLSRGERVVPTHINDKMGGRRLTNEELFKYYQLGRRVSERKEIGIPAAATSARASKDRAAMEMAVMQHAYAEASDKAADKMIAYWKTRPVEKVVGGQKVIEWQEGSGVRRQRIKKS